MSIVDPHHRPPWKAASSDELRPHLYAAPATDKEGAETDGEVQFELEQAEVKVSASRRSEASGVDAERFKRIDGCEVPSIARQLVDKRRRSQRRRIRLWGYLAVGYVAAGLIIAVLLRQIYLGWY